MAHGSVKRIFGKTILRALKLVLKTILARKVILTALIAISAILVASVLIMLLSGFLQVANNPVTWIVLGSVTVIGGVAYGIYLCTGVLLSYLTRASSAEQLRAGDRKAQSIVMAPTDVLQQQGARNYLNEYERPPDQKSVLPLDSTYYRALRID